VADAEALAVGAPTLAETGIVLHARLGSARQGRIARLVDEWRVVVIPFGEDHWKEAVHAYARFGRARHRAALNFGDCLAYAVARLSDEPLLAVGSDFSKTDLRLA
jgi:ribonuclease VapC